MPRATKGKGVLQFGVGEDESPEEYEARINEEIAASVDPVVPPVSFSASDFALEPEEELEEIEEASEVTPEPEPAPESEPVEPAKELVDPATGEITAVDTIDVSPISRLEVEIPDFEDHKVDGGVLIKVSGAVKLDGESPVVTVDDRIRVGGILRCTGVSHEVTKDGTLQRIQHVKVEELMIIPFVEGDDGGVIRVSTTLGGGGGVP